MLRLRNCSRRPYPSRTDDYDNWTMDICFIAIPSSASFSNTVISSVVIWIAVVFIAVLSTAEPFWLLKSSGKLALLILVWLVPVLSVAVLPSAALQRALLSSTMLSIAFLLITEVCRKTDRYPKNRTFLNTVKTQGEEIWSQGERAPVDSVSRHLFEIWETEARSSIFPVPLWCGEVITRQTQHN